MDSHSMFEMMSGDIEHRELAYYVEAGLTPIAAAAILFVTALNG